MDWNHWGKMADFRGSGYL